MICKNCKTLLPQQINYCNGCGAKVIKNRLTLRNLFEDFTYNYLNYDNKFLRTFLNLFTKPEAVIKSYIDGTRKKYVNVISYFAIALTLSGLQMFIMNKCFPEVMNFTNFEQQGMANFQKSNMAFVQEYQSLIAMLFVPVYALMSKLVFINYKAYNFTEHLVINMYLFAHMSIASSVMALLALLMGMNFMVFSTGIMLPLQILYAAYAFKRLFKLNVKNIIIKTLLFSLVLMTLSVLLIITVLFIMYVTGGLDEIMEAAKTSQKLN